MPVDTREKRQTAVDLLVPIWSPGVDPSSLDQAGRQASVFVYSGILAAAESVPTVYLAQSFHGWMLRIG